MSNTRSSFASLRALALCLSLFATASAFANGTLSGTITDYDSGQKVSGVSVSAWQGTTQIAATTTDANGNYSLSLPAGSYTVKLAHSFYRSYSYSISITDLATTIGTYSVLAYKVSGIVGRLGTPIDSLCSAVADCQANSGYTKVELLRSGSLYRTGYAGTDGRYSFVTLPTGDYKVRFSHPDYFTFESSTRTIDDDSPQTDVSADLNAIVTRLRVDVDLTVAGVTSRIVENSAVQSNIANAVDVVQGQTFTLTMTLTNTGTAKLSGTTVLRPGFATDPDDHTKDITTLRASFADLMPSGVAGDTLTITRTYKNLNGLLTQKAAINYEVRYWYVANASVSTSPNRPAAWSTTPYQNVDGGALLVGSSAMLAEVTDLHTDRTGYIKGDVINITTRLRNPTSMPLDFVTIDWHLFSHRSGAIVKDAIASTAIHLPAGTAEGPSMVAPLARLNTSTLTPGTYVIACFISYRSASGKLVHLQMPRLTFFQLTDPPADIKALAEKYRLDGTAFEIHQVDTDRASAATSDLYWVVSYWSQASAETLSDGQSTFTSRYTDLRSSIVSDNFGVLQRTATDRTRKAVFTANAFRTFTSYMSFLQDVALRDMLGTYAKAIASTNDFIAGNCQSAADEVALKIKLITTLRIATTIAGWVVPTTGGNVAIEIATFAKDAYETANNIGTLAQFWGPIQYFSYAAIENTPRPLFQGTSAPLPAGAPAVMSDPAGSDGAATPVQVLGIGPAPYELPLVPRLVANGSRPPAQVQAVPFFLAIGASLALDWVLQQQEELYKTQLKLVLAECQSKIGPLNRALGYLQNDSGGNCKNDFSAISSRLLALYDISTPGAIPTYDSVVDLIGWNYDQGYTGGDRLNPLFNHGISALVEFRGYALTTLGSSTLTPSKVQAYLDRIDAQASTKDSQVASVYETFDQILNNGIAAIDQVDHGTYVNGNYTLTVAITSPTIAANGTLPVEVTLSRFGSGVADASVQYEVVGEGISGTLIHQGNGRYTATFIAPTTPLAQAKLCVVKVTATRGIDSVVASLRFSVLPQNAIGIIVRSPSLVTAEDLAFKAALDETFTSYFLPIADFAAARYSVTKMPVLCIHSQDNPLSSYWNDEAFLAAFRRHMDLGGRFLLTGSAGKLVDYAGVTAGLFGIGSGTPTLRVSHPEHPVWAGDYTGGQNIVLPGVGASAYLTQVPSTLGMQLLSNSYMNCGYYCGYDAPNLAHISYHAGSVMVFGPAVFNTTGTTDTKKIARKSVTYLGEAVAGLISLEASVPSDSVQAQSVEVTATLATAGGPVTDIEAKLDLPASADVVSLFVDGVQVDPQLNWTFVRFNPNERHTIRWSVQFIDIGINNVNVHAEYVGDYALSVSRAMSVFVGSAVKNKSGKIALITGETTADLADRAALLHLLQLVGWSVDARGAGEFGDGLITPAEYDVTVFHYTATDPATLPSYSTAFQNYFAAGGVALFTGSAGKILDRSGVTAGMFGIGSGTPTLRVSHPEHPVWAGDYTGGQNIGLPGVGASAYLTQVPSTLGMQLLSNSYMNCGYYCGYDAPNVAQLATGSGVAFVFGPTNYAGNNNARDLPLITWRIVDYLKGLTHTADGLKLDMNLTERYVRSSDALQLSSVVRIGLGDAYVQGATVTWQVEGQSLSGTLTPAGNRYVASVAPPTTPGDYVLSVSAVWNGRTVSGTIPFTVLGSNPVLILVNEAESYMKKVGGSYSPELKAYCDVLRSKYSVAALTPAEYLASPDRVAKYPRIAIHFNDTTPLAEFTEAAFLSALKEHLAAGGRLLLSGTAPKLLDLTGITTNAFAIRGTENYLFIKNINHPITKGAYTQDQTLDLNGATAAYFTGPVPDNQGIQLIGQDRNCCYASYWSLAEIPYGSGKIVVLGVANYSARTNDALKNLTYRCLDYIETQPSADLKADASFPASVVQNAEAEYAATVTAYGGGVASDVHATLTLPTGGSVAALVVDGVAQAPAASTQFVSMPSGTTHTIIWKLKFSTMGSYSVPLAVTYTSGNARSVQVSKSITVALASTATAGKIALIGGISTFDVAELTQFKSILGMAGWTVDRRSKAEFAANMITAAEYPVTIFHYTSLDPTTLPSLGGSIATYMNAGGHLLLTGTAAEILDRAAITTNAIDLRSGDSWVQITNIAHPITQGNYTANETVRIADDHLDGAYLINPTTLTLPYTLFGNSPDVNGGTVKSSFAELKYGSGRAVILGMARFTTNNPRQDLNFLIWRIVDYLKRLKAYSVALDTSGRDHKLGDVLKFSAVVKDIFGVPVSGVSVAGQLIRADLTTVAVNLGTTDATGKAAGESVTSVIDPGGVWRLHLDVTQSSTTVASADADLSLTQRLLAESLAISANVTPLVVAAGSPVSVSGRVLHVSDATPAYASVTVALTAPDGSTVSSVDATTDQTGAYSAQLITPSSAGYFDVKVSARDNVVAGLNAAMAVSVDVVNCDAVPAPVINASGTTTFCSGGSVTLTSSAGSAYQWLKNGAVIEGATNQTYIATVSGDYSVRVNAPSGCVTTSEAKTVTVTPFPAVPTITAGGSTTFCAGGSVVLSSSSATGNQWLRDGNAIDGANGATYVAFTAGSYSVRVTENGCSATSGATAVVVAPAATIPTVTAGGAMTFCAGGSVTLTSSSATGNQWLKNGAPIDGATSQTYTASTTGEYSVSVTNTNGCTANSSGKTVTVTPLPTAPTLAAGGATTFCSGGSVTLTSSSPSGNQWFKNGNVIAGATAQTYAATASGSYTVSVTSSGCPSPASNAIAVTVTPVPTAPSLTAVGGTTFCSGGSVTLTSSIASGNQWLKDGLPINGANGQTYIATASGSYTATVISSGCSSPSSNAIAVTVTPVPNAPTISASGSTTFCSGGSVTLTSSNAGGNQWYVNGNPISNATAQTYVASASGSYTVVATTGGCSSSASAATVVSVTPAPPAPTISASGSTTFCAGGSVTLTSSSASGNQWYKDGTPINGATGPTYSATAGGSYSVAVSIGGCAAASAATAVTVNPKPSTPVISATSTTICGTTPVTLTSSSNSGNQWYLNGVAINGANSPTYSTATTGSYTVVVTSNGCASNASAAVVLTSTACGGLSVPANVTAAATTSTSVAVSWSSVSGATSYDVYRVSSSGTIKVGTSQSTSYTDSNASANTAYLYKVKAVDGTLSSDYSSADLATTVIFADSLTSGSSYIKATHFVELRTAVGAVRALAGLDAVRFTDESLSGATVKAVHLTELRNAIIAARSALGVPSVTFTDDPPATGSTLIKAVHLLELRTAVQ